MDKSEHHVVSHGRGHQAECCTEPACESGLKNNFFEGKRLTPDMFRIEQRYLVERRRLLNRAVHGWGVVYGYELHSVDAKKGPEGARVLTVGEGLALDRCGRELLETGRKSLPLDELIIIDAHGRRSDIEHVVDPVRDPACWLLSVHYAEHLTDPVRISDPCTCDRHEWDRACETVRYSLRRIDCDDCCHDFECELECGCATGGCCEEPPRREPGGTLPGRNPKVPGHLQDMHHGVPGLKGANLPDIMAERLGRAASKLTSAEALETDEDIPDSDMLEKLWASGRLDRRHRPFKRGGCRCLCDHLMGLKIGGDCDVSCEIEEPCARVRVDLEHGVPIACVRLVKDECQDWTFDDEVEDCGPRRLVKRNDLLFDLIRGCDLTKVGLIGWLPWHRREEPVPFEKFATAMSPKAAESQADYVTRRFWVWFTGPVRRHTLRPDCFAITIVSTEEEGRWWHTQRVPIVRLEYIECKPEDPDLVRGAVVVVDGGWLEDALWGAGSIFHAPTIVEIEFFGNFVLNCNGQPIDAELVGPSGILSGTGTPGGTLRSTFPVKAKERQSRPAPRDTYPTGAKS